MFAALTLQLGYNATLVTLGAMLLGLAAGVTGAFLFLRRRALVPDAMAHATLPGVGLAFLAMAALGGEGRSLPGLLLGAGLTAGLGMLALQALVRRTRLSEDTAIGAVLSVSYGLGIVLLTVIQTTTAGRPAGLEGFILGSTAGMLMSDALLIGGGGLVIVAALTALRRPLLMTAFDPAHAASVGVNTGRMDAALMALVLAVVLIGIRVVGAVLVVALLVTPAATARLWTDRAGVMAAVAGVIGGAAGYGGAALSAAVPGLPTGAVIVVIAAAVFAVSALGAPRRGLLARLGRGRWAPTS